MKNALPSVFEGPDITPREPSSEFLYNLYSLEQGTTLTTAQEAGMYALLCLRDSENDENDRKRWNTVLALVEKGDEPVMAEITAAIADREASSRATIEAIASLELKLFGESQ